MSGLTIKISVFIHEKKYTYFVKKISASRLNNIRIFFCATGMVFNKLNINKLIRNSIYFQIK